MRIPYFKHDSHVYVSLSLYRDGNIFGFGIAPQGYFVNVEKSILMY
jgi:hypothetical protein